MRACMRACVRACVCVCVREREGGICVGGCGLLACVNARNVRNTEKGIRALFFSLFFEGHLSTSERITIATH